jgi:hypothetical protein
VVIAKHFVVEITAKARCVLKPYLKNAHNANKQQRTKANIVQQRTKAERQKAESRPQAGLLAPELRIRVRSSDCGIARAPPPQQKQEGTAAGLRAAPPPARCQRLGANAAWPALPAIAQLAVLFLTRYVVVQSPVACCLDMSCSEMNTTSTSDRLATWRPLPLA